jgi:hypothetical protein
MIPSIRIGLHGILTTALLTGCVNLNHDTQPQSGALLSITLSGESAPDREPAGLIVDVDVESKRGTTSRAFAFAPNSSIPGRYTTFLARLDLPIGHYRITRLSATTAFDMPIPQFNAAPDLVFDVRTKAIDYIGHLEVSITRVAGSSAPTARRVVVADAYEEELPNFVHAWPDLRKRPVGRRALPAISAQVPVQDAQPPTPPVEIAAPLNTGSAAGLAPKAQLAFERFLASGYPRAFAVAASGYSGMAVGGVDVIHRALADCMRAQRSPRQGSCRLFALDDTLVSSLHGAGPSQ